MQNGNRRTISMNHHFTNRRGLIEIFYVKYTKMTITKTKMFLLTRIGLFVYTNISWCLVTKPCLLVGLAFFFVAKNAHLLNLCGNPGSKPSGLQPDTMAMCLCDINLTLGRRGKSFKMSWSSNHIDLSQSVTNIIMTFKSVNVVYSPCEAHHFFLFSSNHECLIKKGQKVIFVLCKTARLMPTTFILIISWGQA